MPKNKSVLVNINKKYFSAPEMAELLGVSRTAIFKKIKSGAIKSEKVGRNYVIPREEYETVIGLFVSEKRKHEIKDAVDKVVSEYEDALKKLGKE
ncbi:MAG: hypothetical protein UW07_C0039G0016 [Candidatus Nomurabacteria bacterium GW2011_GWF2_43_8]|uniref:Helix-turn-helix domain-containing protein n=3 Tax=Candidatus Nomuraibacteriota TaxID=1752729 RepID=A0A0G1FJY4_9BACT|nr:MAG: hypothetical protein UV76_C0001G0016 [Candidatus Nomurabacteria bacterium GW2011_GWA2_43_15]KKT19274.1 MAG: hypothetical protein UW02_C0012G0005 [Candidatus Nomurabacteria bacterium GW2011_GWB1_43_7]KKT22308.1 MAG: hypothetical protein UW07_C0039G0016 [Candidatus Nomurabacteria bacterium GW2011_GWF2_43_8]